ncbi:MAG: hypothetical protein KF901_08180 [Myxococcales bacterium]|nr:hypothetical protein [Myxococcales bacterium]
MAQRRKKEVPTVVRRGEGSRSKRLAPDLEPLARGEAEFIRGKPRRPRLQDPRALALVPGVANRDARAVFEARVEAMIAYRDEEGPLSRLLAEALWMGLWRGRSVTSFDALAEEVLDLPGDEARRLAELACAGASMPAETLTEELLAVWYRAEAALLEAEVPGEITAADTETLTVRVKVAPAPIALEAIGRRMAPLVLDRQSRGR